MLENSEGACCIIGLFGDFRMAFSKSFLRQGVLLKLFSLCSTMTLKVSEQARQFSSIMSCEKSDGSALL